MKKKKRAGKKKRIKIRKTWLINPRTRVRESKKAYSREKEKRRLKDMEI